MALTFNNTKVSARPISHLRWWIGGLLFASTVINYIDRQTLSVLAPYLKLQYEWNNQNFATVVIAFRVAYSIGQTVACLLYTSDAADERSSVDLGGRRII